MDNKRNIVILIPAYNPTEDLIQLTNSLLKNKFKIVVVNDGSKTNSLNIFKRLGKEVKILIHHENKGKGQALKTGFNYILKNIKCKGVVTADADGQHLVEDIIAVANELDKENTIILGSRLNTSTMPLKSKLGNSITRSTFYLATHYKIFDTQTGLRGIPYSMLNACIKIDGQRYEYEINQLLYWTQTKTNIKEIQIHTIYLNNNKSSSFHILRDSVKIYKCIFHNSDIRTSILYLFTSALAFIIDFVMLLFIKKITSQFLNEHISLLISIIIARTISSICSFIFNRILVFKSNINIFVSLIKYYSLVLISVCVNYLLLDLLTNVLNLWLAPSKIFVEILLFIINYNIQKKYIFNKKNH